jgi:long-chain fatty acid transport protein
MARNSLWLSGSAVVALTALGAGHAVAGGFAVREQSTIGQGMSFAGSAAHSSIGAMFWNSAAAANKDGLNAESGAALILPDATLTATAGSSRLGVADDSVDIGVDAIVPSTYISYQFKNFDPNLFLGLAINAPFGLKTEPENRWAGSEVSGATSLFTLNINPMLAYRLSEQLSVGVGAQVMYSKGIFKFATQSPTNPNTYFEGEDLAAGWTAGIMYTPTPSTRIGLGWRSQITTTLDGVIATNAPFANGALAGGVAAEAELKLPDIVTLSIAQALTPNLRAMATVEWSNWSRLKSLDVIANDNGVTALGAAAPGRLLGSIPTEWEDGWFFSAGLEYDVSKKLTVRAGGAYEISPVTEAKQRVAGIPDADRIWASAGFSYNLNHTTTIDFGYSHLFVEDAKLERTNIPGNVILNADLDASLDIVSLGVRMKLDHGHEALK